METSCSAQRDARATVVGLLNRIDDAESVRTGHRFRRAVHVVNLSEREIAAWRFEVSAGSFRIRRVLQQAQRFGLSY